MAISYGSCLCGHSWGDHSADHVKEHKCCVGYCECELSYSDLVAGKTFGPSQLDRVEEKLDQILAWITTEKLQGMMKDLE